MRHIVLIVLNELPLTAHNAFVQCFASQRRIRDAAFARLLGGDAKISQEALLNFVSGLQMHIETKEVTTMRKIRHSDEGLTPAAVMETGKLIRKTVLANLTN